jgi:lipoprotein-anchoring transpeptidase ErfK/SrfK
MPCFQRLSCSDFGFHQGHVPGYPASHGCIRVPPGNAQKLFALTELGDRVEIRP